MTNINNLESKLVSLVSLSELNDKLAELIIKERTLHAHKERFDIDAFTETCMTKTETEFDGLFVDLKQPTLVSFTAYEEWNIKR